MTGKTILREAMKARNYTYATLADIAQLKRASNVSEMFRSSNIRIDNFVRLLNAMGYEVIVKDRTAGSKESWKVSLNDGDADK